MLIGQLVVNFLLVLIVLIFARCHGWGATSEYRLKIGVFAPTGSVCHKISGRRGSLHQAFFCQKTSMNVLSCGVRMGHTSFICFVQCTRLTDRQTDRPTLSPWQYHALHYLQSRGKNRRCFIKLIRPNPTHEIAYQTNTDALQPNSTDKPNRLSTLIHLHRYDAAVRNFHSLPLHEWIIAVMFSLLHSHMNSAINFAFLFIRRIENSW